MFVFQEEFLEGIHYGRELAEISKCHNNESLVLLNIRRVHLIKLDMSTKVRKLVHPIKLDMSTKVRKRVHLIKLDMSTKVRASYKYWGS